MVRLSRYILPLLCAFCLAPYAAAHSLKLFVQESHDRLSGHVYFSGGIPAQQALVALHNDDGQVLMQVSADQQGRFELPRSANSATWVIANSQDGHIVKWPLQAVETAKPAAEAMPGTTDAQALERIVRDAVAKEVAPLKLALQQQQDRAKFSDLLGGVGVIFGLAGVYLWWRSRQ